MSDFEFSVIRPPSLGGQQAGLPNYPVKCLHVPTGIYAVCDYERSQHRNKRVAKAMVEYGLAEMGWKP